MPRLQYVLLCLGRVPILQVLYNHRLAAAHLIMHLPVKCLHSQRAVKCVSQRPSSGNCMYLRGAASPAGPRLSNQEYDSGGGNQASICKAVRKDASLCIPYLQLQRHITIM